MRIAVLSDSHDQIWNLERVLPALAEADVVLHCGDLCSPFWLKRLAEGVAGKPVHVVWGNNDGDRLLLSRIAAQAGNVTLHGEFAALTLGPLRVAMTHYPQVARAVALGGGFDVVCYGHDHRQYHGWVGRTLLLNPGELFGGLSGRATWAWLDGTTRQVSVQVVA